jgi:thioredoxin-related protein
MKKSFYSILLLFLTSLPIAAQEWQTDFDTAKEIASKGNRPIVLVFQGSDWCAPCIKLDREVFSTETFQRYAKDHFVMLQADFPKKKKNALAQDQQLKNNNLAEKYNQRGIFPLVVMLDHDGNVLGETGYMKADVSTYILHLESLKG